MKFLRYLGIIILLIGAIILIAVGVRGDIQSNTMLVLGLAIVIIGFLFHIVANKFIK